MDVIVGKQINLTHIYNDPERIREMYEAIRERANEVRS